MLVEMTAFDWLQELNFVCMGFWSNEKPKEKASNSELRRWFNKGCISINGKVITDCNEKIVKVNDFVIFPKNDKKRITFKFDL
jgi:23S rRNA-/tRNA-specific pseudouridylate synthase